MPRPRRPAGPSNDGSTAFLPRMRSTFPDHELVELPRAKHYIQEDAPDDIAAAITRRFG